VSGTDETLTTSVTESGTIVAENPVPASIIVPGVLAVDPGLLSGSGPAVIVRGHLAGYARLPEITDWKSVYTFVLREAAGRLGVSTAAEREDMSAYPRVHAQVARSRLALIDEAEAPRFAAAGELMIELSYHRVAGGGGLRVSGGRQDRSFDCEDPELVRLVWGIDDAEDADEDAFAELWETDPIPRIYDTILRAMTDGELSLLDVDLALACAGFVHDPASFERELGEIAVRGEEQARAAEELITLLDAAEGDTLMVPGLGLATRFVRPGFTLAGSVGTLTWGGPPLVVAAESWWVVEGVEAFVSAEQARRSELFRAEVAASQARAQARSRWIRRALVFGLVLMGLALARSLFAGSG